jgi:hypothetical protein
MRIAITPSATFATFVLVLLAACSPADNDPGPGGVTVGEARALDEAAAMIEEKSAPPADATLPAQQEPAPDGK